MIGSERILFVDDEAMIANINRQILERLGYTVAIGSFKSTELPMIVAADSNFIYNVLVEVVKLRFNKTRQVAEIQIIVVDQV